MTQDDGAQDQEAQDYQYQARQVELDRQRQFRLGEGKISGYCSVFLGALSLLSVFAYLYPAYLTTAELRQVYAAAFLQGVLKYGMYFSLFFGVLTYCFRRYRSLGTIGIFLTALAFTIGGHNVPLQGTEAHRLSLGLDWLILAFLGSAFIFMTLEKLFPKYKNQVILRQEWGLDLAYFCFNHLAISAIVLYANHSASHFHWAINPDLQASIQSTPILFQVLLIVLSADFVLYWEHRHYHEIKWLWPIHAVHHSVEDLDWLAGSRGHFIQVFSERSNSVSSR